MHLDRESKERVGRLAICALALLSFGIATSLIVTVVRVFVGVAELGGGDALVRLAAFPISAALLLYALAGSFLYFGIVRWAPRRMRYRGLDAIWVVFEDVINLIWRR